MKKWQVADKAEFEARQQCLEFGAACRAVLDIAIAVRESLKGWTSGFLKAFRMPRPETKKPEQLRLDLLAWMALPAIA